MRWISYESCLWCSIDCSKIPNNYTSYFSNLKFVLDIWIVWLFWYFSTILVFWQRGYINTRWIREKINAVSKYPAQIIVLVPHYKYKGYHNKQTKKYQSLHLKHNYLSVFDLRMETFKPIITAMKFQYITPRRLFSNIKFSS